MMSVNLVTCDPDDTVREAARQMDARGVGSVLVVEHGAMTGIFTERDLVRLVARGAPLHSVTSASTRTPTSPRCRPTPTPPTPRRS